MRKINYITWVVNLILFVAVVFLGIKQAGKGAEIAKIESSLEKTTLQKQKLTDVIFSGDKNIDSEENLLSHGFIKPVTVYYFNTEDSFANLPLK